MRANGRPSDQIRDLTITRGFTRNALGSTLIQAGRTMVLCTAVLEEGVPPFLMNTNRGWLTAEYSMLPGSTGTRKSREGRRGPVDGRTLEIGRLIGRSLRSACNLSRLTGKTLYVDCDVLQADGGTRTLAVTGAMVAVKDACDEALRRGWLRKDPVRQRVAAVSVGMVDDEILLDLDYPEDSKAQVDMNVVMNEEGHFVELQSSAERSTFSREHLQAFVDLSSKGIQDLLRHQEEALARPMEDA